MFCLVIALCILADQLTKAAVVSKFELGQGMTVVPRLLDFRYVQNTGAAFSILTGRQTFLIAVTAVFMAAMVFYVWKKRRSIYWAEKLAIALIVGGGLGNLICRAWRGFVVDFIDIHWIPVFNVADMCVCCGCALLVFSVLWLEPRAQKSKPGQEDDLSAQGEEHA